MCAALPSEIVKSLQPKTFPTSDTPFPIWLYGFEQYLEAAGIHRDNHKILLLVQCLTGAPAAAFINWKTGFERTRLAEQPERPAVLVPDDVPPPQHTLITWAEAKAELTRQNTKEGEAESILNFLANYKPPAHINSLKEAITIYNNTWESKVALLAGEDYNPAILKNHYWRNLFLPLKALVHARLAEGQTHMTLSQVENAHSRQALQSAAYNLAPAAQSDWENRSFRSDPRKRERPSEYPSARVHSVEYDDQPDPSQLSPLFAGPSSSTYRSSRPRVANVSQTPLSLFQVVKQFCAEKGICFKCKERQCRRGEQCTNKRVILDERVLQDYCRSKGMQLPQPARANWGYPKGQGR
jgi:hypothetical protein